jgi:hypothetical protein
MAVKSLSHSSILQPATTNSMLGDYESNYFHHLETVRLGGTASSVTFTNLGQYRDYQHLQIRMVTLSTGDNWFRLQINGATSGYYSHRVIGEGGSASSAAYSSTTAGMHLFGLTGTSSVPGRSVIDILDSFETTKTKVARCLSAGPNTVGLISGLWNDTSAVTSITLNPIDTSWASGSRFSIYGIKARS